MSRLCELIETLWHDGGTLSLGEQCCAARQHFSSGAKERIKGAWPLLTVWRRLEPPQRTPPLNQQLLVAVVAGLLSQGREGYELALMLGCEGTL